MGLIGPSKLIRLSRSIWRFLSLSSSGECPLFLDWVMMISIQNAREEMMCSPKEIELRLRFYFPNAFHYIS